MPRTQHKNADGSPKYTNRLIRETSPYLLQHAHNPVNWYPWGDEAFALAKGQNKPILLSIGYSTCHWCHVMERESFEDEEIAAYLNTHYVSIKVDREERPDVDDVYMTAVQMLTGRGGWPMTVVLTPDKQPFFGGTYFPARDGDRGTRKGFLTLLKQLQQKYHEDSEAVVREARALTQRLQSAHQISQQGDLPGPEAIAQAAQALAQQFDPVWGGFGRAPKFPRPVTLDFMLRYHRRTNDPQALQIVTHTLDKMADGGIYDHLGGGFHRYSTDHRWLVPHYEKMLYDNGQLAVTYLHAHQVTGNPRYSRVARDILDYVTQEMTSPDGAFFSATDADSPNPAGGHDKEGLFFTWTPAELEAVLTPNEARLARTVYGVTAEGHDHGRSVLHLVADNAADATTDSSSLESELATIRAKMLAARAKRLPPFLDRKVLVAWNGLMISAFAHGAHVLAQPAYANAATAAAAFLWEHLRDSKTGRLWRSHHEAQPRHDGTLEDYAFLIQALLDLHMATQDPLWLHRAITLQAQQDTDFSDNTDGSYFTTAHHAESLLTRPKSQHDGAEPAGNSVAALNLLRLSTITGNRSYRERALRCIKAFSLQLTLGRTGMPKMLSALEYVLDTPIEVVVVGDAAEGALTQIPRRRFIPNGMLVTASHAGPLNDVTNLIPLTQGKVAIEGKPTAYVCEEGRCQLPTHDAAVFQKQLDQATQPLFAKRSPEPLRIRTPGRQPKPWEYNAATNQYWHPGHGHWHKGRPPVQ